MDIEKYITKLKQIKTLKPKIKPKILISLLTFVAIISTLSYVGYRILRDGIYTQHFSIAGINIEGLYLKLENKLVLDIQKLDLSHAFDKQNDKEEALAQDESNEPKQEGQTDEPTSIDSVMEYIQDGLLVLSYFQMLNVHNIVLPDKKMRKILYDGNVYQIYAPHFEAILNTKNENNKTTLEIETLNIYPFNIQLDGFLEYAKKNLSFNILATYEKNLESLRVLKQQPMSEQDSTPNTKQDEQSGDSPVLLAPPAHLLSPPPPHAQVQRSQYQDIHNATKPTFSIVGNTNFRKIDVEVKSSNLDSLNFLEEYLKPLNNKELEEWLFKRISFESVKIDSFTLKGSLNDKFLNNLSKQMRAKATVKNIKVAVAPKVEPIKASAAHLSLENGFLDIALEEPTFHSYSIKDSGVGIQLPFHNPVEVFVKIRSTKIGVEQPLIDLLKFYNIDIPIQTHNSTLSAGVDIHLRVANHIVQPLLVKGTLSGSELYLLFLGERIFAKDLGVKIQITPDEQNVAVASSNLNYNDILSTSLLLNIYPLQAKIDGTLKPEKIDIDMNKIAQKPLPKSLQITDKHDAQTKRIIQAIIKEQQPDLPSLLQKTSSDVVKATNEKFAKLQKNTDKNTDSKDTRPQIAELNLSSFPPLDEITLSGTTKDGGFELSIPKLSLQINKEPKNDSKDSLTTIVIKDLATLYPYSPALQYYGFKNGSVSLQDDSKNALGMNITLTNLNYPIYTKKGKLLDSLVLNGTIHDGKLKLATQDEKLQVIKDGQLLQFTVIDYDLNADEMFRSNIPVLRENLESESKEMSEEELLKERLFIQKKQEYEDNHHIKPNVVKLWAKKTSVIYDYVIPTDEISMTLRSGQINAEGSYGNGSLKANIVHSKAKIDIDRISTKFINEVMGKKIFAGNGTFDLDGELYNKVFKGQMYIQNTTFKDFAILQNLVALVDTAGNLVSFRKPGFNKDGYEIKNGKVEFYLSENNLGFKKIDLTGSAIDVSGGGLIDLKKRTINLSLKANTMKALGSIIKNIPVAGYIILGNDGKITTNIIVSGSLDNPKTETTLAEDVIGAPFEMLGRAFNLLSKIGE